MTNISVIFLACILQNRHNGRGITVLVILQNWLAAARDWIKCMNGRTMKWNSLVFSFTIEFFCASRTIAKFADFSIFMLFYKVSAGFILDLTDLVIATFDIFFALLNFLCNILRVCKKICISRHRMYLVF